MCTYSQMSKKFVKGIRSNFGGSYLDTEIINLNVFGCKKEKKNEDSKSPRIATSRHATKVTVNATKAAKEENFLKC
ncbi:hypothetical protein L596_017026 [Steinernema carpocapsae]|uniref:Uncharacterized protein n=1 Tax=Steinernema carpocapsae TaxID=34508 RepID=A0A4U5N0Q3_STECR|nr:hypothetical protein L596_017026 [Steinernema carpocapsae]